MYSRAFRFFSSVSKIYYKSSNSYTCRILEPVTLTQKKTFSTDNYPRASNNNEEIENDEHNLAPTLNQQFQPFRDQDASIIFDVDEERKKVIDLEAINALQQDHDPYEGLNMQRGVKGVYDIEDLIHLLRRDKAKEIFVVSVPPELSYVDYLVVVTAKSARHMSALATFVRKVYKIKRNPGDSLPKIEGPESKDWMALDLGNIALHILTREARDLYDLETLWTVGGKYDDKSNQLDVEKEFEKKYNKFLEGFQPADT
ncbi:uncharacterized protein 312 [Venturia canescens]|uniref:uncharacterized protein 312 n=1 Tax=Venturia canescens TaxID=32260 RepID=UPI001C9D4561|nr:uncharacterized protein LOC122418420 [Venturia canescens]